ncbi:MAG: hypothetical protein JJD98_15605 [Polaromonas sp.]|nr:hypothetical protein [Polaromonas sp.]
MTTAEAVARKFGLDRIDAELLLEKNKRGVLPEAWPGGTFLGRDCVFDDIVYQCSDCAQTT